MKTLRPCTALPIRSPVVVGLVLLLTSCGSPEPAAPAARLIDAEFRDEFRIGDGASGLPFADISSMAFAQSGQLVVLDGPAYSVTAFDIDGHEIASWGMQGEGPGEFPSPPNALAVSTDGTVAVGHRGGRVELFALNGEWVESHPVGEMQVADLAFDGRGNLVAEARSSAPRPTFVDTVPERVVRLADRRVLWSSKPLAPWARQAFRVYPATTMLAGIGRGKIATGFSYDYDLAVLDASTGEELGRIARDLVPRGPSEDFVNAIKSELSAEARRLVSFPDTFPMIGEVFAGPPGRTVWIRRHLGVGDALAPDAEEMVKSAPFRLYDLFSSESYEYFGTVRAPEGMRLLAGDSTRVAGVYSGPFDASVVRVMRFDLPPDSP